MRRFIRLVAVICCTLAGPYASPAEARRVALVIGNAGYKIGPLANPLNDAAAVAQAFKTQLKFDKVILKTNLGAEAFRAALAELARETAGADLGVVYFAGHGIEAAGRNFLIPVDASLTRPSALDLEAIPLDTVLGQLDGVRRLKLVILDACRNNPFALPGAKRTVSRGLARVEPEDNTLVVYAARDGTTADDGAGRPHSPFTEALLKHIATPGLEINFVFRRVRDEVVAATNAVQLPHVYGTLGSKEFYLQPPTAAPGVAAPGLPHMVPQLSEAERAWGAVKDTTSIPALEAFRRQYGAANPTYDHLAEARIEALKKKLALATPPPAAQKKFEEICIKLRGTRTTQVQRKEVNRGLVGRTIATKMLNNKDLVSPVTWCIVEKGVWFRERDTQGGEPFDWLFPFAPEIFQTTVSIADVVTDVTGTVRKSGNIYAIDLRQNMRWTPADARDAREMNSTQLIRTRFKFSLLRDECTLLTYDATTVRLMDSTLLAKNPLVKATGTEDTYKTIKSNLSCGIVPRP